jgi:hypothetical protein
MSSTYGYYDYPSFSSAKSNKSYTPSTPSGGETIRKQLSSDDSKVKEQTQENIRIQIEGLRKQLPEGSAISYNPNTNEFSILIQTKEGTKEITGTKDLVTAASNRDVIDYATSIARGVNPTEVTPSGQAGLNYTPTTYTPSPYKTKDLEPSYTIKERQAQSAIEQAEFLRTEKQAAVSGTANYAFDTSLNPIAKALHLEKAGYSYKGEPQPTATITQNTFKEAEVSETSKATITTLGKLPKQDISQGSFSSQQEATEKRLSENLDDSYIFERYEKDYAEMPFEMKVIGIPVEFALGVGSGLLGFGQLGYGLLTKPIETVKEQVEGLPSYVELAKQRPVYVIGQLASAKLLPKSIKILPKPLQKEVAKTGKLIAKESKPISELAGELVEKATPKGIKNAKRNITDFIYGKDIAPQQKITIHEDIAELTTSDTALGSTQTSVARITIQELQKTKGTMAEGVATGQALILEFEKPISAKAVIVEITKTGSELNKQIRQYTGVSVREAIRNLRKSKQTEVQSLVIPFKIKGVGVRTTQGIMDKLLGQSKTETYPIKGNAAGVTFPEKVAYGVDAKEGIGFSKVAKDIETLVKEDVEYSGFVSKSGEILDKTKGTAGSVSVPTKTDIYSTHFHTHPQKFDSLLERVKFIVDEARGSQAYKSTKNPLTKLQILAKTIKNEKSVILDARSYQPSITDVEFLFRVKEKYGVIGTSKGLLIYEKPITGDFYKVNLPQPSRGQYTFKELQDLGLNPRIIPYSMVKDLGSKYQLSLGTYKVAKAKGVSAAKSRLFVGTPTEQIFEGVVKVRDIGSRKTRTINQMITVKRASAKPELGKSKSYRYLENPEASTSQLVSTVQQSGAGISLNLAKQLGKNYITSGAKTAAVTLSQYGAKNAQRIRTINPITKTIYKTDSRNATAPISIMDGKQILKTTYKKRYITAPTGTSILDVKTKTLTKSKSQVTPLIEGYQDQITKQATSTKQATTPISSILGKQGQKTMAKTSNYGGAGLILPPPPVINPPTSRGKPKKENQNNLLESQEQGYNSYAKQSDKFVKLNKYPLQKNQALAMAADATDNSASASFKVAKTRGKPKSDPRSFSFNSFKFTKTKDNGNSESYKEQNTFRIDTQGEVEGISAKGWLAKRNKSKGGLI